MKIKQKLFTSNKSLGVNSCEYIILHHTATAEESIQGVLKTLTVGKVSCHYVVDTNGDIYKIGQDRDILWHAGVSAWQGRRNINNYSIGIEVIGPLKNGGFTDAQRDAVAEIVRELSDTYNIPRDNILRHKDISPGRKIDIMDTFWNSEHKTYKDYITSIFMPQNNHEQVMPLEELRKIWIANVPESKRKFGNYDLDERVKMLVDLGK